MLSFISLTKSIFLDSILDVFYFPIWWYSVGLKKRLIFCQIQIRNLARILALKTLITHLFKPMFGDYSRTGRIISFFMRWIQLIWRLFLFILGATGLIILILIWIFLPIVAVWQIYRMATKY